MATRLGKLSQDRPKYLMEVAPGKVFADVHLRWAQEQGFREVVLCVGNLAEMIEDHCGDGERWGVKITYIHDGPTRLGTGGALRRAWNMRKDPLFAVTYGDTLLTLHADELFAKLEADPKAQGLMTVFKNTLQGHRCNVRLDGKWALYDKENPPTDAEHIDYGFLVFKEDFIAQISKEPQDLAVALAHCAKSKQLLAHEVYERFWEIGSLEALEEFQSKANK